MCLNYISWTRIVSRIFSPGPSVLDFVEMSVANELPFAYGKDNLSS